MKKITRTGVVCFFAFTLCVLTACAGTTNSAKDFSNSESSRPVSAIRQEESPSVTIEKQADDLSLIRIDGKDYRIFGQTNTDAALKEVYNTAAELAKSNSVTAIVKGTVSDVSYVYLEHCPFTIFSLNVEKCYKGTVDDKIIVYEDGGYVPYSELKDDIEEHIEPGEQVPSDDCAMDMVFMNAEHIKEGDTIIAYLQPTSFPMERGSYQYVSSVFGRYILRDSIYFRTDLDIHDEGGMTNKLPGPSSSGFETAVQEQDMENSLANLDE